MKILRLNSTGIDVKNWKLFLLSQGYNLNIDDKFDSITKEITKDFQQAHGLTHDGVVGSETYLAAFGKGMNLVIDPHDPSKTDIFAVDLEDSGGEKLAVVKEVKEITGLGLKESKELVDKLTEVGIYPRENEAEKVKERLEAVGAKVKINKVVFDNNPQPAPEPVDEPTNATYEVRLLSYGNKKSEVFNAIREVTGLNPQKSKEILDSLGIVGSYSTKREADRIKKILTSAGAKVAIDKSNRSKPRPNPEPNPEPEPKPISPPEKPYTPVEQEGFLIFGEVSLFD